MPTKCSYNGCKRDKLHLEWCGAHYAQQWNGEELRPLKSDMSVGERLLSKREISTEGCWLWLGAKDTDGYGRIMLRKLYRNNASVHIISYKLWVGDIPEGFQVHHKCNIHACFNPDHLQLASQNENMAEMHARRSYENRIKVLEKENQRLLKEIRRLKCLLP